MNQSYFPRWVNVALGAWVFISAFLWAHSSVQFNNTWIVGLAAVIIAFFARAKDEVRYLNLALGVWLFASVFVLYTPSMATFWNNLIVGVLMFAAAMTPRGEPRNLEANVGPASAGRR